MSNHIHLIWQPLVGFTPSDIQASFMKYTAQQLKRSLIKNDIQALTNFKVNKYDREYQIWKREPLIIELISVDLFKQKLEYLHYNPVKKQDYAKTRKIIIIHLQGFIMMD
jgi:REP element-mobilizing transposase RayT